MGQYRDHNIGSCSLGYRPRTKLAFHTHEGGVYKLSKITSHLVIVKQQSKWWVWLISKLALALALVNCTRLTFWLASCTVWT